MALRDFFKFLRPKEEKEEFYISSGKRKEDRFLLTLAEAFDKKGKKITKVQRLEKRIDPKQLELAARLDEIAFRCVNFYALQVVGPGFDLISSDENSKKVCQKFCDSIHLLEKLEDIVRDMCITGNGWLEKIFNADENQMVDLARIDSRFMNYKRTLSGFVEEDESGKIIGYEFKDWMGQKKFLEPFRVAHFKLFGIGNELALGFVEPLFHIIYDKLNARKGFSQAQWRTGYPLYVAYVGDKPDNKIGYAGHSPKASFMDKLADEMEDIKVKHKFVLPYWTKMEILQTKKGTEATEIIEFFNQAICGGFGIPYDLAMGVGKARTASLEVAIVRDLDRRVRSIQNKLSIVIENEIFSQLKKQHKLKEIPKIRWREITPPDLNRMAKRITELVGANVIKPEDAREKIYKLEGLPFKEKLMEETLEAIERKHLTAEEAILTLKSIKVSFPEGAIAKLCDELIEKIMLKTTGVEVPQESIIKEEEEEYG